MQVLPDKTNAALENILSVFNQWSIDLFQQNI